MKDKDFERLRSEVDAIDTAILRLLEVRLNCTDQLIKVKQKKDIKAKDPDREKEIIARLSELGYDRKTIEKIYNILFDFSIKHGSKK